MYKSTCSLHFLSTLRLPPRHSKPRISFLPWCIFLSCCFHHYVSYVNIREQKSKTLGKSVGLSLYFSVVTVLGVSPHNNMMTHAKVEEVDHQVLQWYYGQLTGVRACEMLTCFSQTSLSEWFASVVRWGCGMHRLLWCCRGRIVCQSLVSVSAVLCSTVAQGQTWGHCTCWDDDRSEPGADEHSGPGNARAHDRLLTWEVFISM